MRETKLWAETESTSVQEEMIQHRDEKHNRKSSPDKRENVNSQLNAGNFYLDVRVDLSV